MYYRKVTIHNIVDKDNNVVVSIRKANIENMSENILIKENIEEPFWFSKFTLLDRYDERIEELGIIGLK